VRIIGPVVKYPTEFWSVESASSQWKFLDDSITFLALWWCMVIVANYLMEPGSSYSNPVAETTPLDLEDVPANKVIPVK
jgi:hypothetical protein